LHSQAPVAVLLDQHHVLNDISRDLAMDFSVNLDHLGAPFGVCSHSGRGSEHRDAIMASNKPWSPYIDQSWMQMFTDYRDNWYSTADCYQPANLSNTCLGVKGDKSDASFLLGMPSLLVDDQVENLTKWVQHDHFCGGVLATWGWRRYDQLQLSGELYHGPFRIVNDPRDLWPVMRDYVLEYSRKMYLHNRVFVR